MLCKCGCGADFIPSKATLWRIKKGMDSGYKPHHQTRGVRNNHWRGGRFVSADGYIYVLRPEHPNALKKGYPGYIAEHRLVMSEHLGRPLLSTELVHHLNEDRADNHIANLELMNRADHLREHHAGPKNNRWKGGPQPKPCKCCNTLFLAKSIRTHKRAQYCSRDCFNKRNIAI